MSNLVPFKLLSSIASLNHLLEGWTLLEAGTEEKRFFCQYVSFESPFSRAPLVQLSIVGVDASNDDNLRLKVRAIDINQLGFTIEAATWFNTRIWSVEVSWLAIGE
ncbi:MAG TPA: H-type lectin domain-containing protein [Polyangiaceae bacterium]